MSIDIQLEPHTVRVTSCMAPPSCVDHAWLKVRSEKRFEARQGHAITITYRGSHRSVTAGARRHHVVVHHGPAMVSCGRTNGARESALDISKMSNLNGISWWMDTFIYVVIFGLQCIRRVIGDRRCSGRFIVHETCIIRFRVRLRLLFWYGVKLRVIIRSCSPCQRIPALQNSTRTSSQRRLHHPYEEPWSPRHSPAWE